MPSGCTPLATSIGADQPAASRRDTQMPTSGLRSAVPPNQAATRPSRDSTIVDACADGNGARSKMNSDRTTGDGAAACITIIPTAPATVHAWDGLMNLAVPNTSSTPTTR